MFLTETNGTGKSTAMKAAEKCCFGLCHASEMRWTDSPFSCNTYTGSAGSLFGGLTICKTVFMKQKDLSSKVDREIW